MSWVAKPSGGGAVLMAPRTKGKSCAAGRPAARARLRSHRGTRCAIVAVRARLPHSGLPGGRRLATRIGVDVGGTFTDLIYYDDETGEVRVAKEPTTPASPEQGVTAAARSALSGDELGRTAYFLHGTTVGLNSLLTRTGATVGLLCTQGFRDILETRRGDRDEPYNLFWRPPKPLVPRRRRISVTERIRADGEVHVPFEPGGVLEAAEVFAAEGVTRLGSGRGRSSRGRPHPARAGPARPPRSTRRGRGRPAGRRSRRARRARRRPSARIRSLGAHPHAATIRRWWPIPKTGSSVRDRQAGSAESRPGRFQPSVRNR